MAENGNGVAPQAQQAQGQMATHCTGDCRRCFPMQRAYCASQIAYNNMKLLEALMQSLNVQSQDVQNLSKKIEAITNSEMMLIEPAGKSQEETDRNILSESDE